jgi:cell division protein ZapA
MAHQNPLSIKLKIADRDYPMQVEMQEEAKLRAVGKHINQQLKQYREEYGVEDKQDLLAIFAVDCMMDRNTLEEDKTSLENIILQKIQTLDQLLDEVL